VAYAPKVAAAVASSTVVALLCGGVAQATTVRVASHHKTSGTVHAVNGASASGACGVEGAPGNFTLTSQSTSYTVDVGVPSTTFKEHGVSAPSFADVCAGDQVQALGAVSANNVVTATEVIVVPPRLQQVTGTVGSVNGASSSGTCGSAGTTGNFGLTAPNRSYTVEVGANTTTFKERAVDAPSFAMVCVGDKVRAVGTIANGVLNAIDVTVIPPHPQKVTGTVESVNGVSSQGTCGAPRTAGEFVVESPKSAADMVEVGATSTMFHKRGVGAPSFAVVCVGSKVQAVGAIANDIVTATDVTVIPPRPKQVSGTVASVNGSTSCGKSGMAGTFTLTAHGSAYTVDVGDPSTIFKEHGVNAPSFAIVCAGDKVKAHGTLSNTGVLTANSVLVIPNSK
jgi:hypothetical protein